MMERTPSTTANTDDQIRIAERRYQAYQYRSRRFTYRQIAKELGVSVCTAYEDVQAVIADLKEKTREVAEDVRQMELEQLDELQRALAPVAKKPGKAQVCAIREILHIMERRAKLLGLDSPTKIAHEGKDGGPIKTEGRLTVDELRQVIPEAEAQRVALELQRRGEVIIRHQRKQRKTTTPAG